MCALHTIEPYIVQTLHCRGRHYNRFLLINLRVDSVVNKRTTDEVYDLLEELLSILRNGLYFQGGLTLGVIPPEPTYMTCFPAKYM